MVDFWEREYDVLVCTTIVESGLDIPNANTLIIERADMFGLSQLHQLRGRVGRGRERAYAYFLYPPERPLTETAHERLATIAQHTELGAGMYVAMKDLEIRGAGQPARRRAVRAHRRRRVRPVRADGRRGGQRAQGRRPGREAAEVRVELPIDAHIPHDYVPASGCGWRPTRRIAAIDSEAGVSEVRDELMDRYGQLPRAGGATCSRWPGCAPRPGGPG